METRLTSFQEAFILGAFPIGARFVAAKVLRQYASSVVQVDVAIGQRIESAILRLARLEGGVEREEALLPLLAKRSIPVSELLAGPVTDLARPDMHAMTLLTLLPGITVQEWSLSSDANCRAMAELLADSIYRIQQLTPLIEESPEARILPRRTLSDELFRVAERSGEWFGIPLFRRAVSTLRRKFDEGTPDLVFSNGDYRPDNFLSDGQFLTGVIDFEEAAFEDPLIGWARYPVEQILPLAGSDLLPRFLRLSGYSDADMAERTALVCLKTLVHQVPIAGGSPVAELKRNHILQALERSLHEF